MREFRSGQSGLGCVQRHFRFYDLGDTHFDGLEATDAKEEKMVDHWYLRKWFIVRGGDVWLGTSFELSERTVDASLACFGWFI